MNYLDVVLFVLLSVVVGLYIRVSGKYKNLESDSELMRVEINNYLVKYEPIISITSEVDTLKNEKKNIENEINSLSDSYKKNKSTYDSLEREVAIFNETIDLAELGFYEPHYDFDTSDEYKDKLEQVKLEQKEFIKNGNAIYCSTTWTVNGSKREGESLSKKAIRLTARAFNNECDAAIANTSWNNVERMAERIEKAFDSINKINNTNSVVISENYHKLKKKELYITYECKLKIQEERDNQAEMRRQLREEAKLEKDIEQAIKEENKYQKLLEKAKAESQYSVGKKLDDLNKEIMQLNIALAQAHEKSERAKSMAEQTKCGYVYIISNIGSFGEGIYKIGMTRRLEPMDRVRELGDASVPFTFDVHALIYSENAPLLENTLHKKFSESRINLVNNRKEFFRIPPSEIKKAIKEISNETSFVEKPEAKEFNETKSITAVKSKEKAKNNKFPAFI